MDTKTSGKTMHLSARMNKSPSRPTQRRTVLFTWGSSGCHIESPIPVPMPMAAPARTNEMGYLLIIWHILPQQPADPSSSTSPSSSLSGSSPSLFTITRLFTLRTELRAMLRIRADLEPASGDAPPPTGLPSPPSGGSMVSVPFMSCALSVKNNGGVAKEIHKSSGVYSVSCVMYLFVASCYGLWPHRSIKLTRQEGRSHRHREEAEEDFHFCVS